MKKIISMLLSVTVVASLFAGCSAKDDKKSSKNEDKTADIVVIGGGGAGMTSAIQATQDGATNIVIVEKGSAVGGNTVRSTGGLNASETSYQEKDGIKDSNELFIEDTMKGGKNLNDKTLVTFMAENSAAAVDWVNKIGGDLSVVGMFGGASVKRIHRPSDTSAVGPMLVKTLKNNLEENNIPVLLNTKADEIIVDKDGKITGVKVTDKNSTYTINCKAVVLATGGFGANSEMVEKYNDKLKGFGTTNVSTANGDGIKMVTSIGGATVDLDQIQTHPTVNPDTQTMYTEGVRGNGAILINKEGNRFVNELETRDVVSAAILEQTDKVSYMLFDQEVRDSLKAIEGYISAGIVTEGDSIEDLAAKIKVDPANLKKTMDTYATTVSTKGTDEFGRTSLDVTLTTPKYYACVCAPAVHHTMGGVKINTSCEVLKEDGSAITGLFAAGEVVGGVHGANRLGGNAVSDIVVFGRQAGTSAAKYVVDNGGNTKPTIKVEDESTDVKPEVKADFKDGKYTATSKGNNGDVTVEAEIKDGQVISINLAKHGETDGIYQNAVKTVIPEIIKKQTSDVDAASGATRTSDAIKNAMKDIMAQAK